MTGIFEIALSGFWAFIGVLFLLGLLLQYGYAFYIQTLNFVLLLTGRKTKLKLLNYNAAVDKERRTAPKNEEKKGGEE